MVGPSGVTGSVSSKQISVTVNDNGGSVTFTASVTLPTTGKAPYPALIGLGGSFLNTKAIQAMGVAYIMLDNNQVGSGCLSLPGDESTSRGEPNGKDCCTSVTFICLSRADRPAEQRCITRHRIVLQPLRQGRPRWRHVREY